MAVISELEGAVLLGLTSLNIWHMAMKQPSEGKGATRNWQLTSFLLMW